MILNEVALRRERIVTITEEVSLRLMKKPPSSYAMYAWLAFQSRPGEEIEVYLEDFSKETGMHIVTAKRAFAVLVDIELVRVLKRYTAGVWKIVVYQYDPPSGGMNSLFLVTQEAKARDGNTCQITGAKSDKLASRAIHAHHIYSRSEFEAISLELDNLICLSDEVHRRFHAWNGGVRVPCDPDCLIRFVKAEYPNSDRSIATIQRLEKVKHLYQAYI